MTQETKFAVGDRVEIIDLERQKAVVNRICIAAGGVTYEVNWFHGGEQKVGWLFEHELSERRDRY